MSDSTSIDPDQPTPAPRKVRFAPKVQNRRKTRSTSAPKTESVEEDDVEAQKKLLQHFNERENRRRQRQKAENKSSVQPTFVPGTKQSATAKASDGPQDGVAKQSNELELMELDEIFGQEMVPSSTAGPSGMKTAFANGSDAKIKDYKEPWNYAHSYYPTTLPWRRPYSGDPDVLDEAEFGEATRKDEYDRQKINPASELGFLNPDQESEDARLLFLQLPQSLPALKRSASAKGKEIVGNSSLMDRKALALAQKDPSFRAGNSLRTCSLEELPAGQMGKLLVYKSGAVKLKLGETLYDVSPGSNCAFAQDIAAIDINKKAFCAIGDLDKRAIVTPDVDYLLNSVIDLG